MTNTKQRAKAVVGLAILVVSFGIVTGAFHAKADEPKPTPADLQNLQDIRKNQKCIADNRDAFKRIKLAVSSGTKIDFPDDVKSYNRFVYCKGYNESESAELAKNGWCVKWEDLTLERCPFVLGQQ